jgi:uracil-DNA glycosylase
MRKGTSSATATTIAMTTAMTRLLERNYATYVPRHTHCCRGCDLWRRATQTVFGAGPARAPVVLVGEQPGDEEDRSGEPFAAGSEV